MRQQNFLDALKDMMEMDKDGTYSSFKPLPKVSDPMFTPEQALGMAQAFSQMGGPVQAPRMDGVHRGGGMISLMPHSLEGPKTAEDFAGLLSGLAQGGISLPAGGSSSNEEGPMIGGLLDLLKTVGQVKNLF